MGLISSSSQKENNNNNKIEEKNDQILKEPKDNIKKSKNNKKPKNNTTKRKKNSPKNSPKNIYSNKLLKQKNKSGFTINTLSAKRSNSKDKPNKEIRKIIFQSKKRNAISQEKNINKNRKFNKQKEPRKHSINYKNYSKRIDDEDDYEIIFNDDFSEESFEHKSNQKNKKQNKMLREKINITKKKIINLRKKLNTEINNSSKDIKNKITNNITLENNNIKQNKISNTIFINNSNITINNTDRNFIKRRIIKKKNNNSVMSDYNNKYTYKNYNNNTYINSNNQNSNLDSIEFDDFIQNVYPSKIRKNNNYNNKTSNKKMKIKKKFFYTESDVDFQSINLKKENSNELSLSQYDKYINKKEDNKTIIYKMEKLKEKIKSKINNNNDYKKKTPSIERRTCPAFKNKKIKKVKSGTLDNKHIKKNIPNYRRSYSRSNNIYMSTLNSLVESIDKKEKNYDKSYPKSLMDSNTKKKSIKNNYNFSFKRREKNNQNNTRYSNENGSDNNMLNYKSIQLNNNSKEPEMKNIKNKKLYNIILQNIIAIDKNNNNENNNDTNNIDEILIVKYRDAIELDISSINKKESLMDKELIDSNINNKIIINFSKLENISSSQILFDGVIYKVVENSMNNSEKKFKIMERYFQLKKNCFRYFNNIQLARYNSDKPLVQFDIRHIKDLKVINNKIFEEYNLNGKKIEFSFVIFLNQNSDFFIFFLDKEIFGNSLFSLMNLLKNYYEDKNNNSIVL